MTLPESNAQAPPSSKQPVCVMVCSVGVGLSHRIGTPVETVASFGTKYGEPLSMMMAVYGAVAVVCHGTRRDTATKATMTGIFVVMFVLLQTNMSLCWRERFASPPTDHSIMRKNQTIAGFDASLCP